MRQPGRQARMKAATPPVTSRSIPASLIGTTPSNVLALIWLNVSAGR
jgi:hypothetical protein